MVAQDTAEQVLVRILIGESDKFQHVPVYEALVELFRKEGFAGATVVKGIAGFAPHSIHQSDRLLRLTADVPVVVEVIDERQRFEAVFPKVAEIIDGGLITMEPVSVWRFPRRRQA